MTHPWIIELVLPDGVFVASELTDSIRARNLDAEIHDSYAVRPQRSAERLSEPSLPSGSGRGTSLALARPIPEGETLGILLALHHDKNLVLAIRDAFERQFLDPSLPWSDQRITDALEILRRFYGHR
jgi:hypothetical protein